MNKIPDDKYRMLVNLLIPSGRDGMQAGVIPWSMEKFRTFTRKCGHKVVLPFESLSLQPHKDDNGNTHYTVTVAIGRNMKCAKCGGQNYELMSFAHRYGLMTRTPQPKRKKQPQPMLPFEGYIECRPKD